MKKAYIGSVIDDCKLNAYQCTRIYEFLKKNNSIYSSRRDILVDHLKSMGFTCEKPKATFYVWLNCRCNSLKFASKLLEVGVAVTPGIGFGKYGENYVRFSLTQPEEKIIEACKRMNVLAGSI
ncbi:aminotransferase class I/II-fold pyridoxal phosphate-dependent enzyme [Candidatus Bathyarchaeota archaeon]|nr:aminotransferase class I/II-fold pyridoxal phosphate-dependent enzyme [Candidatus Bathyarchaeota archaeon]